MYGVCKLCLREGSLKDSHIIPRSFFKRMKRGSNGQLIEIPLGNDGSPFKSNANPSEYMLCGDCEQLLSTKYEAPAIRYLRGGSGKPVKADGYVKLKDFDFRTMYLFFISILWRASASSLETFGNVQLGQAEEVLRRAVHGGKNAAGEHRKLSDFVAVSLSRVVDRSGIFSDEHIKLMYMNFGVEFSEDRDAVFAFFMIEGFLVIYCIDPNRVFKGSVYHLLRGEIIKRKTLKIPECDFRELGYLHKAIADAQKKAKASPI